jgi:hypothetical protein
LNAKRKKYQDLVVETMKRLDKSGANAKKYAEMFAKMDDKQFDSYVKAFARDEDANFFIEVIPFETEPTLKMIAATAEWLGVPLEEYVFFRHEDPDGDPVRTSVRVPVGYLNLKRLQQILSKKNTMSLDIDKRDMLVNQVTGDDKIARISNVENYALSVMGADEGLKEFLGPRSDDGQMKRQMYSDISTKGYSQLQNLSSNPEDSQALSTVDVFFAGAGLKTDLITKGMAFPRTMRNMSKRKDV